LTFRDIASDELLVALRPDATYRELLARDTHVAWRRALRRPAFVAFLIGSVATAAATGHVSAAALASTTVAWSFAVALQLAVGAAVILSAPTRRVSMPRAMDLWFAGHLPWSLWLLLVSVVLRVSTSAGTEEVLLTLVVPMAWTAFIASAFCRIVLGATPRGARLRAAAHQSVTLALVLSYVAWSAGGWFRLLG
jgi:hypothetical protein